MRKGSKHSEITKLRMKKHKRTKDHCDNLSKSLKGKHPWNYKGKRESFHTNFYCGKENDDFIFCSICREKNDLRYDKTYHIPYMNRKYHELTKHLSWFHGITKNEYLKMHPGSLIVSKNYNRPRHPAWNKNKKKETNVSVAKYANKLLGIKRTYIISPRKDNKPEKKLQVLLSHTEQCFVPHFYIHIKTPLPHNVNYKDESGYEFSKKSQTDFGYHCDVYVPDLALILECDGKYWHGYDYWINNERIIKKSLVRENGCVVFYPALLIKNKEAFVKLDNKLKNIYIQQKFLDIVRTLELSKQKFIVVRMWDSTINKMKLTQFERFLRKF